MIRRMRAVLAWLRTWNDVDRSERRRAWGPDDPPADDATDAEVIARMEAQFDPAREEDQT